MLNCAHCQYELPPGSRFCNRCGVSLVGASEQETVRLPEGAAARWKISSTPDEGRLPPGTLLIHRYRISNRLGKGGMGEVYKAADLLLGQTVALKFLPQSLLADGSMLERFRNEVRLARQVSHPNVCRVYDLGEADGQPFLSMEFIDGEDLASLLRRIGHLPETKSLEIARKLCAGLAAAHEKGVVHRDFKPANIMIDSRGHVMITDFGLAVAVGEKPIADPQSGTPAYMSPEQLAGADVTARSDLYALGCTLYEMFSGQRPYGSVPRESAPPPMKGVDPAVEAVIRRCLNTDPSARPATALAVAAVLPGADPVAAALAAGETPTPGMVAASGSSEAMNPRAALACFASLLVGIVVLAWICGKGWPFAGAVEKSPEAMSEKARDLLARLGYTEKPVDSAGWYGFDYAALGALANLPAEEARRRIATGTTLAVYFTYRSSPVRMVPQSIGESLVGDGDPPLVLPAMSLVRLDPQGRLRYLRVMPPAQEEGHTESSYDWSRMFEMAGLDPGKLTPVQPAITPAQVFDARGAWRINASPVPLRVEAAAWRGRPVWFTLTPDADTRESSASSQARFDRGLATLTLFWVFVIGVTSLVAYRNFKLGRADARGTIRISLASGILGAISAFPRHLAIDVLTYDQLMRALVTALLFGLVTGVGYLALEPFIRRRWPAALISWTRALRGEFRDPLVGRDLLLGLLSGVWLASIAKTYDWISGPAAFHSLSWKILKSADGLRLISPLADAFAGAISWACWGPFVVVVTGLFVRKRWLAICLTAALFAAVFNLAGSPRPLLAAAFFLPVYVGWLALALNRYGMGGLFAAVLIYDLVAFLPLTLDISVWYFNASVVGMLVPAGLGCWGFRSSIAWRKPAWER